MKTFLKIVLLVILAVVALKLLPLAFALGCILAAAIVALAAVGVSVLGILLGVLAVLAAVSSPIWIPALAVIGLVALCRRGNNRPPARA